MSLDNTNERLIEKSVGEGRTDSWSEDQMGQQQRVCKHERRGSFDGPSVPQPFREAAAAESSRSHEFRQKLMRLVVGSRGADVGLGVESTSVAGSAHPSPVLMHSRLRPVPHEAEAVADVPPELQQKSDDGGYGTGMLAWPSKYVP